MKIAFYISSVINMKNIEDIGFGHSSKRTAFSDEERFRQTQFTIANIRSLFPEATIFHFEIGENSKQYQEKLSYIDNLKFIIGEDLDAEAMKLCRSNPSKGLCETVATELFLEHYKDELKEFDFLIKIGGRYFFTSIDKTFLSPENTDKYLCKNIRRFEWLEWWGYPEFLKDNGHLNWTPSQSYIVGTQRLNDYQTSLSLIKDFYIKNPETAKILDFECMLYHYILKGKPHIEIPWINGGWGGQDAVYNEY
jgi:hypothetical protein